MINLQVFFTNLFLITSVLLKLPKESRGLTSFRAKNNFLNSPASTERFLNVLIILGILLYFFNAFQLSVVYN